VANHVIQISDKEAANEFASLRARVREGVEVIVEYAAENSTCFPLGRRHHLLKKRFILDGVASTS